MYCLVLLSALLACTAAVPLTSTKPMPDGRIVGGTETDITSHPYQVSVLLLGYYLCSASIISANWAVTVASCVDGYGLQYLNVRSGSTDTFTGGTVHSVTRTLTHEKYYYILWDYDISLVQVSPAFTFSISVQPITLECNPVPVGTEVVVTGWGKNTEEDKPLEQATLQIISDSICNSTYPFSGRITDRMICAQDPIDGKGACGDYGAPLVASSRLIGMYTWASGCGDFLYAQVFTKVSTVCDWIINNAGL